MVTSPRVRDQAVRSLLTNYLPPGPKAQAYISSADQITLIMGPEGSGKSVASGVKKLWAAQQQAPSPHDGVIYVKGYVIRATYRDLWDKTIPTYWQCWPKNMVGSTWVGGKGEPATHTIELLIPDPKGRHKNQAGLVCQKYHLIHEFRAISDATLSDFIAGLEATWIYLNEVNTLPDNVLSAFYRRCGRYPSPDHRPSDGVVRWFGVFGDFNAEDEAHWLFKACVSERKEGLTFIVQPSGFSAEAENMRQLRKIHPDYYRHRARQMEKWEVRRMIENRWGFSRSGEPVFGEDWDDDAHVAAAPIDPDPQKPFYAGLDGGGRPAAVLAQEDHRGALVVFAEFTTPDDAYWDVETFARKLVRFVGERWPGLRCAMAYPDPANRARLLGLGADLAEEDRTWIAQFAIFTGWPVSVPHTNDPQTRVLSVRKRLRLGARGFRLSPACAVLRAGFNSGYRLRRANAQDGAVAEHERIVKNRYSHPHDALQYLSMMRPMADVAMDREDMDAMAPGLTLADPHDLEIVLG
jgi:hypothetical protein